MVDVIERLGIPNTMHDTFRAFYEGVQQMSHPIDARRLRLLDDGDTLPAGGRDWQVHVTPGHSVGHVSLYEPDERVLLSGDHLLACINPNPRSADRRLGKECVSTCISRCPPHH